MLSNLGNNKAAFIRVNLMCELMSWLVCVCVCVHGCDVKPETAEVHVGPAAASELHEGNHQHGNTQRLWLHKEAPS